MKSLSAAVCDTFAREGLLVTPAQVRAHLYRRFRAILPALRAHGWPIPTTDEGIFVCLELLPGHRCRCNDLRKGGP